MKKYFLVPLLGLLPLLAYAVPQSINYQGAYRESGIPVTGNRPMTFRITDSGGAVEYWTSGEINVNVSSGVFRASLLVATPVNWGSITPYLEVSVGTTTLLPRDPITSTAYAFFASTAQALAPGSLEVKQSASDTYALKVSSNNGTGMVVVNNKGSVGIGTTNPGYPLQVENPAAGTIARFKETGWAGIDIDGGSGIGGIQGRDNSGNAGNLVINRNGGNVGIGTTEPTATLELRNPFGPSLKMSNDVANYAYLGADGFVSIIDMVGAPTAFQFRFDGTPRFTVLDGGNVGIGTTGPGYPLTVQSNAVPQISWRDSTGYLLGVLGHTGSYWQGQASLYDNNTEKIRLKSFGDSYFIGGNVGIGTVGPSAKLQVTGGDAYISTAGNGLIVKSPDGLTCRRIGILDTGALSVIAITCP